ncbi:MAG: hydrogenase subunit MbhD domain-containing protein, partial [Ignisphaera sp.]
ETIFIIIGLISMISVLFVALAIISKDLLKAIMFSAVQSTLYAFLLFLLMAPDIVLVYIAISVGLLPLISIVLIKKVGRYEKT